MLRKDLNNSQPTAVRMMCLGSSSVRAATRAMRSSSRRSASCIVYIRVTSRLNILQDSIKLLLVWLEVRRYGWDLDRGGRPQLVLLVLRVTDVVPRAMASCGP